MVKNSNKLHTASSYSFLRSGRIGLSMLLLSEKIFLALYRLFRVLGLVFVLEILLRMILINLRHEPFRYSKSAIY